MPAGNDSRPKDPSQRTQTGTSLPVLGRTASVKCTFPLFPPRASTTCILAQGEAGLSVRRLHPNRFASGNRTWPDFSFFIPNKIYDVYCLGVGVLNVIANVPLVPRRIKFPPKSASSERA